MCAIFLLRGHAWLEPSQFSGKTVYVLGLGCHSLGLRVFKTRRPKL